MKLTIGYARVSTTEQFYSQSLDRQIDILKEHGVDKIFRDVESGANSDRAEFQQLIKLIQQGEVRTLKAVAWDRLMRDPYMGFFVKDLLREHDVQLFLLNQGEVDLSTAAGELSADMQIMLGAYERKTIIERINRVHKSRRKDQIAWQVFPFGYRIINNKYELDTTPCVCPIEGRPANYRELSFEDEPDNSSKLLSWSKARISREMVESFLELRKASKVLQRMHARFGSSIIKKRKPVVGLAIFGTISGLKRWLRNPILQGHTCYQKYPRKGKYPDINEWNVIPNTHPGQALITSEEYQEIEEIISSSFGKLGKPERTYYLTGKVVCQKCGGSCDLKRGGQYSYYACGHSRTYCDSRKHVRLERIEEAIIYRISTRANEIYLGNTALTEDSAELAKTAEIKKKIQDIENLSWSKVDRDLSNIKRDLCRELETEMNKPRKVSQEIIRHPQAQNINFWYTLTKTEREIFYGKLVDRILIVDGKVLAIDLSV
ncbi:recombinase family protein (plasmid) [Phormidium sp. CLA17]|uniref:recombinase family protein n=1 Tax=Leptolyngbya sp. Cla-17 TaxID=2803751 RepID=UPI0014924B67|nr:recombinase family protein [Leptolyngbya sp. Cla-17]MBM0745349.1 recombinase family protein [Leptolyngbya sp. Cla-17]